MSNKHYTILLVEDEKLIALGTSKMLKSLGYNVEIASSGIEAIECVNCLPEIDLILMDIDLGPGIDGTGAAQEILKIRNLPIIFLTSHSEDHYVNRVKGITKYGYIVKNSGDSVLRTSIEMGLELFIAHKNIQQSEEKFRKLVTNLSSGLVVHNPDTSIAFANQAACDIIGLSLEQMQGKKAIHPEWAFINEDLTVMDEKDFPINKIFQEKNTLKNYVVGFRKPDQSYPTWVLCNAFPVYDDNQILENGIVTFHEITERIQMEQSILASNKELDILLEQKEIIIKEIHHRVKNNLVLITSLLALQADESDNEKLKIALKDAESRVCGMVNLYNQLFINEEHSVVSVKIYLEDLLQNISEIYSAFNDFDLQYDIKDLDLDPKKIINLGIIVNEVITNSIKYAFPGKKDGKIYVRFYEDKGVISLEVEDNGQGFSPDHERKGFGLRLIEMLVRQLNGKVTFVSDNGTRFKLNFSH